MNNNKGLNMTVPSPPPKKWECESVGINFVPLNEQTAHPSQLFWVWCSANIGVLGILYGAIIMSFGLSFFQAILVMILGLSSFGLVGIAALAGFSGRTNTLTLSRRAFGKSGNQIPALFSWVYLMGWESVNLITGTFTLVALCHIFGFTEGILLSLSCLATFASLIILISFFGIKIVMKLQKIFTQIFGGLTLLIVLYVIYHADWEAVLRIPNGNWLTGFLPAVSIIMAGTGIGWTIAGADYSRTQAPNTPKRAIFYAVIIGASIPLFLLMLVGVLLSVSAPELAGSDNPIAMIGSVLPHWMSIPYLIVAVGAMLALGVLSLYSASLTILTLGTNLKQQSAVFLNAGLVLCISLYILFISQHFMNVFMNFLFLCGLVLSGWSAIFIIDFLLKPDYTDAELFHDSFIRTPALICWFSAIFIGMLMTKIGFIHGPFAIGIFENSKLGLLITFFMSGIFYYSYRNFLDS